MTNKESEMFNQALSEQQFNNHDLEVILAILKGNGSYHQDDIIVFSDYNCNLLRKLGWLRRVKKAIKSANIRMI